MLVLMRRTDEAVMIGDDVRVVVVSVDGDRVRLGIDAPPAVQVHRQEVWERIHAPADVQRD